MLAFTGCAKQGLVKNDQPIAPAAVVTPDAKSAKADAANAQNRAAITPENIVVSQPAVVPVAGEGQKGANGDAVGAANLQHGLSSIYFGFDSASLDQQARQKLTEDLEVLKHNSQKKVRIEGYCDERGSDEYNLALGERRAQAAAKYLAALGVSSKQLTTISYGNEKPADPGHDEAAWSKNRRDEFVLVP
ncbi:peptidoglycan-associated lipoprotein Pal [Geomonas sp. Red875]|uniref:Peptidoglycan-associated protein n=2 Tax=Geomesophilobacter sediminis TaxID=2798584 RepID=A0A8J7M076_9BACT|nr:peptidoglycan-associated lipoprotein Pal [Geomesophilobacter sediminis]